MSLHNRYCALGIQNEGQSNNEQGPGDPNHSIPSLLWETVAAEKDVTADSLLWGTKASVSHPDFSLQKFTAYQQIAITMPLRGCWAYWTLQITIYSNTILCRVCGKATLNTQKRLCIPHCNTKSPGAQVMFSSVLPGRGRSSGKRSQIERWMPGYVANAILKVLASTIADLPLEAGSVMSLWDSPEKVEQKAVHQQAVQTYMESIKLDLVGKRILSNREKLGAVSVLETNTCGMPQRHRGVFI